MPRLVLASLAALALGPAAAAAAPFGPPAPSWPAAAASQNEVDDLGEVPPDCGAVGRDYADPSCTTQTRLGTFSLSPHVVHAGGVLTGTVALNGDFPISWPEFFSAKQIRPCTATTTSCSWRIPKSATTAPYSILTVGITNEQGTGISKDYYAVIGKDRFELAGHVVDEHGKPVEGVPIRIKGPGVNERRKTDYSGAYNAILKRGRYVVTSERKGMRPVKTKDCRPVGTSCHVYLIQDRTADFEIDAPTLIFKAKLGAKVRSQRHPSLIEAGTPFLVRVTLRNTSREQRVQVMPIYARLSGNAADGHLQATGMPVRRFTPDGTLDDLRPSPTLVLAPKQTREFDVVVRTTASNPYAIEEGESPSGGTRAVVRFDPPEAATLDDENTPTPLDPKKGVEMTKGSDEIKVGVDDSVPDPPPASYFDATWSVTKGLGLGLWRVTWGTARGLFWDLPSAAIGGILSIPQASLAYVQYEAELWNEVKDDPVLMAEFLNPLTHYTQVAMRETPWLLEQAGDLSATINAAIYSNYSKMWGDWYAGDWRNALTDMTAEGTEQAANVALALAPGVLARLPKVQQAWAATKAAAYARVGEGLATLVRPAMTAAEAVGALRSVMKAGYVLQDLHLEKLFGVSAKEAAWLRRFAKAKRLLITFRSRAASSVKWIAEGAVLKPAWIKLKTVNWHDVKYLGYQEADIGRLVLRKPVSRREFYERVFPKIPVKERAEAAKRWFARSQEWESKEKGMGRSMFDWHAEKSVEGKWPWSENLVDPAFQADEVTTVPFQLVRREGRPGEYLVEVWNTRTNGWASVTGDVDFLSITHRNGAPLTDAEHVKVLKEMRDGPVGAMHPESATWKAPKAIRDKYSGFSDGVCCEAQVGADGQVRAVTYNAGKSSFKTPVKYTVWWDGGYLVP